MITRIVAEYVKENPDNENIRQHAVRQFPKIADHILGQISAAVVGWLLCFCVI